MSLQRKPEKQRYGNSDISISWVDSQTNDVKILSVVDVWISESHDIQSMSTHYPIEDGSSISDNVYVKPTKIQLEGYISNIDQNGLNKQKILDGWAQLSQLQKEIVPVRVSTNLDLYGAQNDIDMFITRLQTSPITADSGINIQFRMVLSELKIVESEETSVASIPPKKVTGDNNPAKNSTTQVKSGKKRSTSLAVDLFNNLKGVF